jgi:hypothetical protein
MDTRFWGPGAWRLLHTITFSSEATAGPTAQQLQAFFEVLPYVLPCKFCRASLTDYYEADPVAVGIVSSPAQWLYRIHNRVNGKLRKQGLAVAPNPTFAAVRRIYDAEAVPGAAFPAWDFLYSIAYNNPLKTQGSPMPGAAAADRAPTTDAEKNRWNVLPPEERYKYWCRFWTLLPTVLPPAWQQSWMAAAAGAVTPCRLKGRRDAIGWLWNIRCKFDTKTRDPYRQVCSRLSQHSSGCATSRLAKTCRRRRAKHRADK